MLWNILERHDQDVVKTRIQNKNFGEKSSALSIVGKMITTEGPQAFFKGLTPKLLTVGPKLVFSFSVAQFLIICGFTSFCDHF